MEIEFSPTALKDLALIKRSHSNATKNCPEALYSIMTQTVEVKYAGCGKVKMVR